MKLDILIVGVGGQGVLLASEILANMALRKGLDVKKSEIHGMAQRGGSVFSFVRIGEKVYSPVISMGTADVMVAFEELEALRYLGYLKEGAKILVNTQKIMPISVLSGDFVYPDGIVEFLSSKFDVLAVDALSVSREIGDTRLTNMVLLGILGRLAFMWDKDEWIELIVESVPKRFVELNIIAFDRGWNYGCKV